MDVQTALLGVTIFVISGGVLLLIAVFGIKEKSYEEAIAEQKQHTNTLFGSQKSAKLKDKKQKKLGKKVKEKEQNRDGEEESEGQDNALIIKENTTNIVHAHHGNKMHVEFKEPAVMASDKKDNNMHTPKKRVKKQDKVRPILVNKDVPLENIFDVVEVPSANHFEELHPMDDFELLHNNIHKEEVAAKVEASKEKEKNKKTPEGAVEITKNHKKPPKQHAHSHQNSNQQQQQPIEPQSQPVVASKTVHAYEEKKIEPANEQQVPATVVLTNNVVNTGKEKKKRKAEFNTLQQLSDKQGINVTAIMKLVRTAELSRSEVQTLIDLLLNKQHEGPAIMDEWSEGKADPVQKLKKQLADRERALKEEQEALVGAQAKLREIRAEQIAERANMQQRIKQLQDMVQARKMQLAVEMQQLQTNMVEERMKTRKMLDENAAVLNQRQQQLSQADAAMLELRAELQEMQQRSNVEAHALREQHVAATKQLQHQLNMCQNECAAKEDIIRTYKDGEEKHMGLEANLKGVVNKLMEENREMIDKLQTMELFYKGTFSEMKANMEKALDEKRQLEEQSASGSMEVSKMHQIEVFNLKNELASIASELEVTKQHSSVELNEAVDKLKQEVADERAKNNELRDKNHKVIEALNEAETRLKNSQLDKQNNAQEQIQKAKAADQQEYRQFIQRLFPKIDIPTDVTQDGWLEVVESAIEKHMAHAEDVKSKDVSKLQADLKHYKVIIDDTEMILKKLQDHLEIEELRWKTELEGKEAEIKALKEKQITQLQNNLTETQQKLTVELEANQKLAEEIDALKKHKINNTMSQPDMGAMEKLSEEVNRLRHQLTIEQTKNEELQKSLLVCNSKNISIHNNATNGTAILSENNQ